ncbi:MAG: DUF2203 domain-containing protein [Planctomycetota bacterium]|nr:DUF2203 domain-containing protein [Planctomycetota bacterium]
MATEFENASTLTPRAPRPGKKYFSLDEANRALPYVRRVVDDLKVPYARMSTIQQQIELLGPDDARTALDSELKGLSLRIKGLLGELRQVGVELKDYDKLLLDFPAIHEGREIYLCWHREEPAVQTWHEVGSGFSGRQDVALLKSIEK